LTRTRPDFDLKVDPISKVRGSTGSDDVSLQVRLLNPTSGEREIHLPTIARLDRVDASGSTAVDLGVSRYTVGYILPNGGPPQQPLRLAGGAGLDLRVTLQGLDDPGSYKGTMRFTATDRKPLDAQFELALRLPWWCAAVAIGLGVAAAAVFRYYQQTGRPRLLLQRDALGVRAKLTTLLQAESSDLAPRERQAIAFLIQQVDEASDRLATPDVTIENSATIVGTVRRKLPLLSPWITLRRRHDAIRPSSVAAVIEPDLDTVFATLMNAQATDTQIAAAQNQLDGLDPKLKGAIQKYIVDSVVQIRTAIDQFPKAEQLEFDAVRTQLTTTETEANVVHLEEARAALDRSRVGYVDTAARLLRQKLDSARPAVGFDQAEWTAFVGEIKELLNTVIAEADPEQRIQRWDEANRRYLLEVVRRAKNRMQVLLEADVAGTQDALKTASAELTKAEAELAASHLGPARTAYEAAMVATEQARPTVEKQLTPMGAPLAPDAPAPNAGGGMPSSILDTAIGTALSLPLGHGVSLPEVDRSLKKYAVVFGLVILVIAILTGLQLLYVPNPAFGWGDLPVAFLWGAGLHVVAGTSFQGLQGLAQQFR
jgi:hypothetical protein